MRTPARTTRGRCTALLGAVRSPVLAGFTLTIWLCVPSLAIGQQTLRNPSEAALAGLAQVKATLGPGADVRSSWTDDGVLSYLGAPAGQAFPAPRRSPGRPEVAAIGFLEAQRDLFGIRDATVGFGLRRITQTGERRYLRLEETVDGVPVFGAELVVQLSPNDDIQAVLGNIARGSAIPPAGVARPPLDAAGAAAAIRDLALARGASTEFDPGAPRLVWFVPAVLREEGPTRLAWYAEVRDPGSLLRARWLVDATEGSLLREYTRSYHALARQIRDMSSDTTQCPAPVARGEGGPPSGVAEVNDVYDMIGDADAFYRTQHGRDGINNASALNTATVRVCTRAATTACPWNPANAQCPWSNASYASPQFWFGSGWVEDDIVAHEWTHGVTDFESDLIYANESGAINESLSDVWGEFVDLGNGRGNDAANVRWLLGEDLASGTVRDMKDPPTVYGDPDRRNHPSYVPAAGTPNIGNDFGGVHTNSGVNNKLCYLLTDGATFNGLTITGFGVAAVADLYYEAQVNLLGPSSGWIDLYNALQMAAINLSWTVTEQNNLYFACLAVEIATPSLVVTWVNAAAGCFFPTGSLACSTPGGPFATIAAGIGGARPGETVRIVSGSYPELLNASKAVKLEASGGTVTIAP